MRVMITGATGFVGKALCKELARQKYSILASSRTACKPVDDINFIHTGEINGETKWNDVLHNVDIVIHLAARVHVMKESSTNPLTAFRETNVEGTENLAKQASAAGVKRFIYISSVKVNGECNEVGAPFDEEATPQPQDAYGVSKYEAEQKLLKLSSQMDIVIIRPPLIYGSGVKANFAHMLKVLDRQLPLPLGNINNKRSLIYLGNLIDFIVKCIEHPKAANHVFLISDRHDISTTELLQKSAAALNVKVSLWPVPVWFIKAVAVILSKKDLLQRLYGSLQVDSSKAHQLLDWTPPFSMTEGLKVTASEWKRRKE